MKFNGPSTSSLDPKIAIDVHCLSVKKEKCQFDGVVKTLSACNRDLQIKLKKQADELKAVKEQLQRQQEELRQTLQQEKELHELKSRFVSMTSHEFRTPLATILGSTELLKYYSQSWSEEKKLFYLHRIQANVQHMSQMLEEVLLLSKAEVGKLECQLQPLDLTSFCRSLVEELQLLPENHHRLQFAHQNHGRMVKLDEKLLRHILGNLLANAIKYSPPGSVVRLELTYELETVVFQIHDQGIGIPQKDQKHLFEPFYRASNVGQTPGMGMGLAIVKKAVDLQQGEISVHSSIGMGSTFTVTLPVLQR